MIKLPKGWSEISAGLFSLKNPNPYGVPWNAWIHEPIESNKFLIVSWRMSGSEFCKEFIRENYPSTNNQNHWPKTHIILEDEVTHLLIDNANTKVFISISDPREVAMNLVYFDNGLHLHAADYETDNYIINSTNTTEFFKEIVNKQIDLVNHYKKVFGDNCLVLKYEDILWNQNEVHNKVSHFLQEEPLGVDGSEKYKSSIYKNVGDFNQFFDEDVLDKHYDEYKWFYEQWGYPKEGLLLNKYK